MTIIRVTSSLLCLLACKSIVKGIEADDVSGSREYDETCSLFLAEIVDHRGALTMGVFTSKPLIAGQPVGFPDIVIPLVDIPLHNSPTHEDEQDFWWVWNDLVWDPTDVGGTYEGMDVKSAAIGLGSLTRGNPEKANVVMSQSQYDSSGLDRTKDPGAGAISYYHGSSMIATDNIESGSELYFHHGFQWYLDPHDQERALLENLPIDDPRVKELWKLYDSLGQSKEEALTGDLRSKLWGIIGESPMDSKLQRLLPDSWNQVNGVKTQLNTSRMRTPEWLAEHGICLDNIRQGPSDISQAGRGAFTTRLLVSGAVIAAAPLVHVLDKKALNMYAPSVDEAFMYTMSNEMTNKQLLINYCFGHPESTKLLCPIGSGTSFINHSPTPNAAIRWSTHKSTALHKEEWLNMTVEQMGKNLDIGLMIEYFTLRDIEPDEEVTINYGLDWEKAWDQHVRKWQPPATDEDYYSAEDLNGDPDTEMIMTIEEQQEFPYPSSVVTSCFYEHVNTDGFHDDSGAYADPLEYDVIIKQFEPFADDRLDFMFLRPCVILSRDEITDTEHGEEEEVSYEYVVQILNSDHIHDTQKIPDYEVLIVQGLPRDSIIFTDFAYSSDTHLTNSFRQEMIMSDGLFPNSWRNLKQ